MKYKYLEHISEAQFIAYGDDLEDLFKNALQATVGIMLEDVESIQHKLHHKIIIHNKKLEVLLFEFLQEIIFLLDSERILVGDVVNFHIKKNNGNYDLEGEFVGDIAGDYPIKQAIKSVTYNYMKITMQPDGSITAQVVVDV